MSQHPDEHDRPDHPQPDPAAQTLVESEGINAGSAATTAEAAAAAESGQDSGSME